MFKVQGILPKGVALTLMRSHGENVGSLGPIVPLKQIEYRRIWGMWGSYCNTPKAMLYLLKGTIAMQGVVRNWGDVTHHVSSLCGYGLLYTVTNEEILLVLGQRSLRKGQRKLCGFSVNFLLVGQS